MRRLPVIALFVALLVAAPAAAAPRGPLHHKGRWLVDRGGRVVTLHGVNMVYKVAPYTPVKSGFGRDDARWLARHGFNTVRLGLIYAGVEPRPGEISSKYIDSIARTERTLSRAGIFSLLDFHQDLYSERFQGEGFPDWAVQDDGLPAEPQAGFPGNYFVQLGLQRAYDHFWANDDAGDGSGLQDHYARAWRRIAKRFRGKRHVLGYDLFNEPFPGTPWLACANPLGCPAQDASPLGEFSKRVIKRIRAVDRKTLAFYEPWVVFDFGAATSVDSGDPRAALSFHDYCLPAGVGAGTLPGAGAGCGVEEDLVFNNADDQSDRTGDGQLLTEFGATDDLESIQRVIDYADGHMTGWQYWHYCACGEPTSQVSADVQALVKDPKRKPRGKNVKRAKLKVLDRPYPQAVAGTPTAWSFDPASRRFEMRYRAVAPSGRWLPRRRLTEVFLPQIQYANRYKLAVKGARVVSKPRSRHLRLKRRRGAASVSVVVTPRG